MPAIMNPQSNQNKEANQDTEAKAPVPCSFEELKDEFLIQREIGRGKSFRSSYNLEF